MYGNHAVCGALDEHGQFISDVEIKSQLDMAIRELKDILERLPFRISKAGDGRRNHIRGIRWLREVKNLLGILPPPHRYSPHHRATARQHSQVRHAIAKSREITADIQVIWVTHRSHRRSKALQAKNEPMRNIGTSENSNSSDLAQSPASTTEDDVDKEADPLLNREPRIETRVERDGVTTMLGLGESYRPNRPQSRTRTPPRTDTFRSDRDRSPRRLRSPPATDSYHPGSRDRSPRRRSPIRRSPPRDNWRTRSPPRARSPPRRYSPRRDDDRRERARSPRNERRRSRSPYDRDRVTTRARSPVRRRSPPSGPRGSYRAHSRSPVRRDDRIPTGPSSSNWRRRSPSPPRDSERSSTRTSGSNSRRSSPHVHPSRLVAVQQATRPRSPPMTRERSPPAQTAHRDRDSARSTPRERSPIRPRSPPRGPATFRPPTGPGASRNFTAPSPSPTMSRSTPMAMSAHNRSENAPIAPPAGPRAQFTPSRGAYVGRGGRGSFGHDRQSRPDPGSWGAAPSRPANDISSRPAKPVDPVTRPPNVSPPVPTGPSSSVPTGPSGSIPTGPRASAGIPSRPSLQHSSSLYGNRAQSAATSGPRPHPAMANMPQIIPGGRIDPTASGMSSEIAARLKRREDEAEILRADLEAKQDALRKNLKEYERIKNESAQWALRTQLSDKHVRALVGEGVGGPAF